jgi:DNA repair protein SbcC/Rad50
LRQDLVPLVGYRERLAKLQQWAALKDELAAARETKRNTDERLAAIISEIEHKAIRREELNMEQSGLLLATHALDEARGKLPTLRHEIQLLRDQELRIVSKMGGLQAELSALENDEKEKLRLLSELEPNSKEWSRYQKLIKAFGKDGIPALIIENSVPELERIANEILGQMSKGRHYIRFETQKELKSRDGVSETLDIIIGDWTSERPYETFSGGEQLRIDYAIRFALAELLARRAGSRVEWLTIDEGLGSQDAEHRGLVLEAIKSVADRFKKVLVITHIEDAQAVFDQQIVMENTGERVEVRVS